jgi:hypothetical protein
MSLFLLLFSILILAISLYLYSIFSKHSQNIDNLKQTNKISNDYSEFEEGDIDRDVDEMSDDCLIYDDLFGDE